MSNNSSTPTYSQPDNSALIQQQKKNCIATAESSRSVCESNAKLLSDTDGDWLSDSSQRKAMFQCYYNYTQTLENNCN